MVAAAREKQIRKDPKPKVNMRIDWGQGPKSVVYMYIYVYVCIYISIYMYIFWYMKKNEMETPVKKQRRIVEADGSSNEMNQLAVGDRSLKDREEVDRGRGRENECQSIEGACVCVWQETRQNKITIPNSAFLSLVVVCW